MTHFLIHIIDTILQQFVSKISQYGVPLKRTANAVLFFITPVKISPNVL